MQLENLETTLKELFNLLGDCEYHDLLNEDKEYVNFWGCDEVTGSLIMDRMVELEDFLTRNNEV